jgi:hypothetical protein
MDGPGHRAVSHTARVTVPYLTMFARGQSLMISFEFSPAQHTGLALGYPDQLPQIKRPK